MSFYIVTLTGTSREVYWVQAENAEEARQNWFDGKCTVSEASDMEIENVVEFQE